MVPSGKIELNLDPDFKFQGSILILFFSRSHQPDKYADDILALAKVYLTIQWARMRSEQHVNAKFTFSLFSCLSKHLVRSCSSRQTRKIQVYM